MPLALQAKLLRVLQDGEVRRIGESRASRIDVRILCATHRDLSRRVREGRFREDLYYRLKVLSLEIPPLRERREDILPLARHFLSQELTSARRFSPEAEQVLQSHNWTGNVRELRNAVRHGAALARSQEVSPTDLPEELRNPSNAGRFKLPDEMLELKPLHQVEREHILRVLRACNGSPTRASLVLGIGRNTLWRKLKTLS